MNGQIFQDIFYKIQDFLPDLWNKIVLYASYTEGSYSMKFYVNLEGDNYIDCFSIPNIDRKKIINMFIEFDKMISIERNNELLKNKWNVLTMIVDSEGNMKTYFDYRNIDNNIIEYENEWKNKYLYL